jgi:hypothetical protein
MAFIGKTETLNYREAFDYYFSLGASRSFNQVAVKFKKSERTIHNWGKAFNWQKRIEQRDIEIARRLEEKTNETIIDEKAKYREEIKQYMQFVRGIMVASQEKIKNKEICIKESSDMNSLMLAYERLLKLDLLLMGEATDRSENTLPLIILPDNGRMAREQE